MPSEMPPKQKPKQVEILNWVKPLTTHEERAQQQARQQAKVDRSRIEAAKQREKRQWEEACGSFQRGTKKPFLPVAISKLPTESLAIPTLLKLIYGWLCRSLQ